MTKHGIVAEALRAHQVLFAKQDVLAVTLDERTTDELRAIVVGERADDTADHAAQ